MKHHKAMAMYDCLKFINQAAFTVLIIGISTYLATKNIITVGSVLTAYLCFNQLIEKSFCISTISKKSFASTVHSETSSNILCSSSNGLIN